jgi:putative toxin-antitoxin system antitoxin component (TIGR02293 family)
MKRRGHGNGRKKAPIAKHFRTAGIGVIRGRGGTASMQAIEEGLPVGLIAEISNQLGVPEDLILNLAKISSTSDSRRKLQGRFTAEESDRLFRLGRIGERTIEFFAGDREAAHRWLERPESAFGGSRPIDLLVNDAGVQEVDALLGRLDHGVFV